MTIMEISRFFAPYFVDHERCKFGNLTLHVGDELSHASDFPDECVECKCEVPPTLTCKRLPDEQCQIKYPHQLA